MPRPTRIVSAAVAVGLMFGPMAFAEDRPAPGAPGGDPKPGDPKVSADIHLVTAGGTGDSIGIVTVVKSSDGAVFNVTLRSLPPGPHGMHIHEKGSCDPGTGAGVTIAAGAAGGHWDPGLTGKHLGPHAEGHAGDLPVLEIIADGTATKSILAPRVTDPGTLRGHALVIHAKGDNYSDKPAPLGGGGERIACGVFE